ncbi:MAG: DUF1194 domain-containing protein [Rhodospirillales bacterium]|nr:DUF1194 domain-containing protein [Rhodospirillales bacterium]
MNAWLFGAALFFIANWTAPAAAQSFVDLELVIATDTSRSIDEAEARLQREGVAAALKHPDIIRAIGSGYHKKIAVAYIDYSSRDFSEIIVDWRVIKDKATAINFAQALMTAEITLGQRTSISDGLEMAAGMIQSNSYQGTRRVIDVAGDGPNNHGRLVLDVRNEILAKGITINGLPIMNDGGDGFTSTFHIDDLDDYYRGCVIGGAGAFLVIARDFKDFARAIRRKLVFEIAAKPAPLIHRAQYKEQPFGGGYVYKQGCDIGERMWRRRFMGADEP